MGSATTFQMLTLSDLPCTDFSLRDGKASADLNAQSQAIQRFLHYHGRPLTVAVSDAEGNAGLIETDSGGCFVQISPNYAGSFAQRAAILSHEIMHAHLYSNGLFEQDELQNEILTDVATIYFGLGKLVLNGILQEKETGNSVVTQRVGYLDPDSFCFVYLLLCDLRNIDEPTVRAGLDQGISERLSAVWTGSLFRRYCGSLNAAWLESELLSVHAQCASRREALSAGRLAAAEAADRLGAYQAECAVLDTQLSAAQRRIDSFLNAPSYNPILHALRSFELYTELSTPTVDLSEKALKLARFEASSAQYSVRITAPSIPAASAPSASPGIHTKHRARPAREPKSRPGRKTFGSPVEQAAGRGFVWDEQHKSLFAILLTTFLIVFVCLIFICLNL